MEAGDTFLRVDTDKHLWVVISDPVLNPENVLIVNLTSLDHRKERACVLNPGDHPWITHDTCVNYEDSLITTQVKLEAARMGGAIRMQHQLAQAVLRRVLKGAVHSARMKLDNANIVVGQNLFDCLS